MTRTCRTIMVSGVLSAVLGTIPAALSAAPPASTPAAMVSEAACGEGRYPYDAPAPWLHGYFQETPAYGGFHVFRPYNYKHVFVQSQIAAEWGASPTAPYSHHTGRPNSQSK